MTKKKKKEKKKKKITFHLFTKSLGSAILVTLSENQKATDALLKNMANLA